MTSDSIFQPVSAAPSALLALHTAFPERYPALLDSAASREGLAADHPLARFDILFAHPRDALVLHADGTLTGPGVTAASERFLTALDRWWRQERIESAPSRTVP